MSKTAVRRWLIVLATIVWLGVPRAGSAGPPPSEPAIPGRSSAGAREFIPLSLTAYPTRDAAGTVHGACAGVFAARAGTDEGAILLGPAARGDLSSRLGGARDPSARKYLPVLYSLLVPGAGELVMGHYVRGSLLLAAELTAWTGYIHYHNQGLDSREAYEEFADAHWDYDRWIVNHLATQQLEAQDRTFEALDSIGRNVWDQWPGYHTWHSKEEEKQNYYENIGKYDWFISGWEDWDPADAGRNTDLRDAYRAMRRTSNDELDKASKFVYLSIAARVCSLIDTFFLVRGRDGDSVESRSRSGFSLDAHATGFASGQVALVYHFQ